MKSTNNKKANQKWRLVFPPGIIKYFACIVFFAVAVVFMTKDVIIKDILSGSVDFETVLAVFLILFFGFAAFYILPKYLKANLKQWILLRKKEGNPTVAKEIFRSIPQVTFIYATSDGWRFGGKSPYIENDETYVLADSKSLLAKEIFALSCKNKLNLYYPMHIDSKDIMRFFEGSLYYGFEKFSFLTDNGMLEISIKDILNIEKDCIEESETNFLHNHFIFMQKIVRKRAIEKTGLPWTETEQNELNVYAKKCEDAFGSALFYVLTETVQKENVLLVSEKASAQMDADTIAAFTESMSADAAKITNAAEMRPLCYIFSKANCVKKFRRNTEKLSLDEEKHKWESILHNSEKYTEEEQVDIRRNYAYICRLGAARESIINSTACIITGAELRMHGSRYLLNTDRLFNCTEGDCIDCEEWLS